jgi:hypothetical protein
LNDTNNKTKAIKYMSYPTTSTSPNMNLQTANETKTLLTLLKQKLVQTWWNTDKRTCADYISIPLRYLHPSLQELPQNGLYIQKSNLYTE